MGLAWFVSYCKRNPSQRFWQAFFTLQLGRPMLKRTVTNPTAEGNCARCNHPLRYHRPDCVHAIGSHWCKCPGYVANKSAAAKRKSK